MFVSYPKRLCAFAIFFSARVASFIPSRAPSKNFRLNRKSNAGTQDALLMPPTRLFSSQSAPEENVSNGPRDSEFSSLEPLRMSRARQERIERERINCQRFASENDLWHVRSSLHRMRTELEKKVNSGVQETTGVMRKELWKTERRDPGAVYKEELKASAAAENEGRFDDAKMHMDEAKAARSCLPEFHLEGLWIGKYASHYQMINITYVEDTLVAFKVTGDKKVPRGEMTFTADLHPLRNGDQESLAPVVLSDHVARKWDSKFLPRYAGKGKVAEPGGKDRQTEPGFDNHRWLDGQLIVISRDYFGFVWIDLDLQIFFGRPSAEVVLKMIREGVATMTTGVPPPTPEDDPSKLKDHAFRCLEATHDHIFDERVEGKVDPFSGIWHGESEDHDYFE